LSVLQEIRVWNETAALKEKADRVAKVDSGKEGSMKKGAEKDSDKASKKAQKSEEKNGKDKASGKKK
jgi:hypothetical protein